ncbi:hypothetical protein ACFQ5D_02595 [Paenibacillus farraposensis]|uniref:Beta-lactamase n=1 Tax=Paenibacillus farraposensis TaxID=2807095 RepID=A0ABW4D6L7_9BACL|nr:hypothetical protein [Paenibacillus farraposensis]
MVASQSVKHWIESAETESSRNWQVAMILIEGRELHTSYRETTGI